MKRILIALVGTVAGLIALLSFKSHPTLSGGRALPAASLPSATPSSTGRAPTTSTAAPPSPGGSTATTKTLTGQAIQTQYGVVQVRVVVSGQTIENVSFVQLTADDPRSAAINSQAAPILLQQTLSAQGAQIDGVSGATYTSAGYVQSLQSALDQAGIR